MRRAQHRHAPRVPAASRGLRKRATGLVQLGMTSSLGSRRPSGSVQCLRGGCLYFHSVTNEVDSKTMTIHIQQPLRKGRVSRRGRRSAGPQAWRRRASYNGLWPPIAPLKCRDTTRTHSGSCEECRNCVVGAFSRHSSTEFSLFAPKLQRGTFAADTTTQKCGGPHRLCYKN